MVLKTAMKLVERGIVPEAVVRIGIKNLLRRRLAEERAESSSEQRQRYLKRLEELNASPIALVPEKANEQHYELPPDFFTRVLGPHLKYSSCLYPHGDESLADAEAAMLQLTAERAELADNQAILELGCGWGSLTLWMAERYPNATIVAVSNSADQRRFILDRAESRGLTNIEVLTCDMNEFAIDRQFDRVVSVEMFEHMRNYEQLLQRISTWLKPDGKLFIHIFCHRELLYPFEARDDSDWMARYFFTGGLMPSFDTLAEFQKHLLLEKRWAVNGSHYARTSRDWIANLDRSREAVISLFESVYGSDRAAMWFTRWRLFFLACEELFGYNNGEEWLVGHYRFTNMQPDN